MESFFLAFTIIGLVLVVFALFALIADAGDVATLLYVVGAIIIAFGLIGGLITSSANLRESAVNAADKQGITLVSDSYDDYDLFQVIYGDCKIGAEVRDGQLILAGSEPAKLLTPELVEQICVAEVAR